MPAKRPIIGCTTYRKHIPQTRPIDVLGLMTSYIEAVKDAGGIPVLIPPGLNEDDLLAIYNRVDGVLLPGGGDIEPSFYNGRTNVRLGGIDEERDRTEIFLTRQAVAGGKPILAICRGLQVFNVALGGTLWEDICALIPGAMDHDLPDHMPRNHLAHSVTVDGDSILARMMGKSVSWVNSIHHQAIQDVAAELNVTAEAPDGIIEAAEIPEHSFAVGVQWHPENLVQSDPAMLAVFEGFVEAATK